LVVITHTTIGMIFMPEEFFTEKSKDAVKICDDVYWVGAIDYKIRDFHGYFTPHGTTYNAYLILGDEPILIDTVKREFFGEMLSRISSVVEPEEIKYIVALHSELDHSGSLPAILKIAKHARVIASEKCQEFLKLHHHNLNLQVLTVEDGTTLKIGNMTCTFLNASMLHWPDNTMLFLHERGILFSSDAFGQHLATRERFSDQVSNDVVMYEAKKYYANIISRYAAVVTKKLNDLLSRNFNIEIIAPAHGVIWRGDLKGILDAYLKWSNGVPEKKAVVVYDTMWGSTARMAHAIASGIMSKGVKVKVFNLRSTDRSEVLTEVLDACAIVVGSPTLNNTMFPTVADFLTYLKGFKLKNKIGAAFGSYGWSGEAPKEVLDILKSMGFEVIEPPLRTKYVPSEEDLAKCQEFGTKIGDMVLSKTA